MASSIAANNTIFPNDIIYLAAAIDTSRSTIGSYAHILLLKVFLLFGDPLSAATLYWSFVVALTTALVYVNARILSHSANYFNGLLAVYLFFSSILIFQFSGVIFAEFSLMLFVTLGVTIYLLYQRLNCCPRVLLVLLGVTIVLAWQTKIIGGSLVLLLVGLKWVDDEPLDWATYAKNLGLVAAGAVGMLLFMIVLFGSTLRLDHTNQDLVSTAVVQSESIRVTWYWLVSFRSGIMLLVSLYLIAMVKTGKQWMERSNAVVWGLPLVLLILLPATVQFQHIFWEERHFFVILPITSVLAAQVFRIKPEASVQSYAQYIGAIAGALVAVLLVSGWVAENGSRLGWSDVWIQSGFVFPIGLTLLFALFILFPVWNVKTVFAAFFCLFLMTVQPITQIPTFIQENNTVSTTIFYPYADFSEDITYTDEMSMYISPDVSREYGMLSQDSEVCALLFSVFFDVPLTQNEFSTKELIVRPSGEAYFTYILLTTTNWSQFSEEQKQTVETLYHMQTDTHKQLVLGAARGG